MNIKILSAVSVMGIFTINLFSQQPEIHELNITIDAPVPGAKLLEGKDSITFQRRGYVFSNATTINIPERKSELEEIIHTSIDSGIEEPEKLAPVNQLLLYQFLALNERGNDMRKIYSKVMSYLHESKSESFIKLQKEVHESQDLIINGEINLAKSITGIKPIVFLEDSSGNGFFLLFEMFADRESASDSYISRRKIGMQYYYKTTIGYIQCDNYADQDEEIALLLGAIIYEYKNNTQRVKIEQK